MPVIIRWWQALNPAIYLVSVLPGVAVWMLHDTAADETIPLILSTAGVVLLQHAINLFNDAKDWQLGADQEKLDSWVRVHDNNPHITNKHAFISLAAGSILGLLTLFVFDRLWVLVYALPFVVLGLLYNFGRRPLSYSTAGEWVTGICYGPGVFGSLWFVTGQSLNLTAVAGMLAFAALSMSLLFSHQPPQIDTDRAAGKNSFAVRYGAARTYLAAAALFALSLFSLAAAQWLTDKGIAAAILFICAALIAGWRINKVQAGPRQVLIYACVVFLVAYLMLMLMH